MLSKTFKTLLITILFLISISNTVTTDDDCITIGNFYQNGSVEYDCFFIVGSDYGPTERIGSVKFKLMAYSEPFSKILNVGELSDHGDIALPDIEPGTFKDFLKCVYGCCDDVIKKLSFKECVKMSYITEKYLVTQFKEKVISRLLQFSPLNLDNTLIALSNHVYLTNKELNKVIADQLSNKTKEIFDDKRFLSLDNKALMIIVKQGYLNVPEIVVWEAVLKWGVHKSNSNNAKVVREKIGSFLEFIRFCSMNLKEFYNSVVPAHVLTSDEVVELSTSLVNKICSHNISGISQDSRLRYVPQNVQQEQVVYLHYVKNVTELLDEKYHYSSEPVEQGEYSWKIRIGKNSTEFSFCISCEKSPTKECHASIEFILINHNYKLNQQLGGDCNFKLGMNCGYPNFIDWNDLIDPAKGYIKDNHIIVMTRVKLIPTE